MNTDKDGDEPGADPTGDRTNSLFETCGRPEHVLHPGFVTLRDSPLYQPARELLCNLRLPLRAGEEFIERFQTTGFDSCIFEIFLATMFECGGHAVDVSPRRPRLVLEKEGLRVVVEPVLLGADARATLAAKLREHAWTLPPGAPAAYVLALEEHTAQRRSELAADFFEMPGAENVSALLFCGDNGSILKFNRIGQEAGHRSARVRMLRYGSCRPASAPDNPALAGFVYEVGERNTGPESWNEETVLIHNPRACTALPQGWLGAAAEQDDRRAAPPACAADRFVPERSVTEVLPGNTPTWWIEERAHLIAREAAAHGEEEGPQTQTGAGPAPR